MIKNGIRAAGMLLKEGLNKGAMPTLQVLEITSNKTRQYSDILPYLGDFSHYFAALPQNLNQLRLRTAFVPLSDIECVTKTLIKVPQSLKVLSDRKGKDLSLKVEVDLLLKRL